VSFETVRVPIEAVFEMCKGRQIFAWSSKWSCTGHENAALQAAAMRVLVEADHRCFEIVIEAVRVLE
jgi:hypothetical protein